MGPQLEWNGTIIGLMRFDVEWRLVLEWNKVVYLEQNEMCWTGMETCIGME